MVLKVYGSPVSTCTKRVGVILQEKKIPYELVTIDWAAGEHKTPAYLEKQPFGQVPYIDDDGFILYESRAIGYYLAAKYPDQGTPLVPAELKANALLHQALSVEVADFDEYASKVAAETTFRKFRGLEPDYAAAAKHLSSLDGKLDAYDRILSKQKYLAGDGITIADLFHLPHGTLLSDAKYSGLETRPNVARWWKDISSRPSWQAVKESVPTKVEA